jgi:C-terminal processing protease CtpA/Prc
MEEMEKRGSFQSLATNDAARDAATGVTGGLGVIVTATAKVVLASVADNGTADDRVRTVKLDHLVDEVNLGDAVIVGSDVAEITVVTRGISGTTVLLALRRKKTC